MTSRTTGTRWDLPGLVAQNLSHSHFGKPELHSELAMVATVELGPYGAVLPIQEQVIDLRKVEVLTATAMAYLKEHRHGRFSHFVSRASACSCAVDEPRENRFSKLSLPIFHGRVKQRMQRRKGLQRELFDVDGLVRFDVHAAIFKAF